MVIGGLIKNLAVLRKISTNLLSLIHVRGSLIPLPKFSGLGMGVKIGRKRKIKNQGFLKIVPGCGNLYT